MWKKFVNFWKEFGTEALVQSFVIIKTVVQSTKVHILRHCSEFPQETAFFNIWRVVKTSFLSLAFFFLSFEIVKISSCRVSSSHILFIPQQSINKSQFVTWKEEFRINSKENIQNEFSVRLRWWFHWEWFLCIIILWQRWALPSHIIVFLETIEKRFCFCCKLHQISRSLSCSFQPREARTSRCNWCMQMIAQLSCYFINSAISVFAVRIARRTSDGHLQGTVKVL